ncbi:hypothetical protein TWF696_001115 [Orbilia brochopaga]|uniref:Galectin domain-containing protein n=1 Tax=Orbilia brochopaga TaxID=3140254 RepID=A0AAV9VDT8_9PEZI
MLFSTQYLSTLAVLSCAVLNGVVASPLELRTNEKKPTTCAPFRVKAAEMVQMNPLEKSGGITIDTFYTTTGRGMSNLDFYDSPSDTHNSILHFSIRNLHDRVILNTKKNGAWATETRPSGFTVSDVLMAPHQYTKERKLCITIVWSEKDKAFCVRFFSENRVLSHNKPPKSYEVKFPKPQWAIDAKKHTNYLRFNAGPTPMLSCELHVTPLASKKHTAEKDD